MKKNKKWNDGESIQHTRIHKRKEHKNINKMKMNIVKMK